MLSPRFAGQAEGSASTQTNIGGEGILSLPTARICRLPPSATWVLPCGVGRQVGPADLDVGGRAPLPASLMLITWTPNGTPGLALAGARSTSSGGQKYGGEGSHFENGSGTR